MATSLFLGVVAATGVRTAAVRVRPRAAIFATTTRGRASSLPMEPSKVDVCALDDEALASLLADMGEPAYRSRQIQDWIFNKGVFSFEEMRNLPRGLRDALGARATVGSLALATSQTSADGTRKYLWRLRDGQFIETVMMPYADGRRTACISSQVGCAMGCTFCATGQLGFRRDLTRGEILEQALRVAAELRARGERLSGVVLMGQGEPFRNYESVLGAVRDVRSKLAIGARHITISTVGIAPMIRRFAEEGLEVTLAVSLHVANDSGRSALMPVNRRYALDELMAACRYYCETTKRRISFEWALIHGQNDSDDHADELVGLLRGIKAHVNCIPLNPTDGFGGKAPGRAGRAAKSFCERLERRGLPATVRVRRGIDIDAGCGQLANKVLRREEKAEAGDKAAGRSDAGRP